MMHARPALADGVRYTLDPLHTQVDFRWNHLGLSSPVASFDQVEGTLEWDGQDPTRSHVRVRIPVESVRTRVRKLDLEMLQPKYFDAKSHPYIEFRSTRVERAGIGNQYRVYGDLSIKGSTRPFMLDARVNGAGRHPIWMASAVGFDANGTLNRSDYGLMEFLPMVSDRIDIRITTEAIESRGYEKTLKERESALQ